MEKVDEFVDFPTEGLDLRDYVEDTRIKDSPDPVLYDLYAVSNHNGNLDGGGYYTACCYNYHLKKWYNFNDSSVFHADQSDVVTRDAYLLFYSRRDIDTTIREK